jgi:hypothetical protein
VRLLEGVRQGNNASYGNHGIAFGSGGGRAGYQIACARSRSDKTDSRPSGQTPNGSGHEGGVLFVPADDQMRTLIVQYVKSRHDFPPGMPNICLTFCCNRLRINNCAAVCWLFFISDILLSGDMSSFLIAVLWRYQAEVIKHLRGKLFAVL